MFILIVTVYGSIELRELFDKGTEIRDAFKMWHFMLGLSVLALVSVRLVARVVGARYQLYNLSLQSGKIN